MLLRDLATTWVRANCLGAYVQQDFLKELDSALQHGVGCSFHIGRRLTEARRPYLVTCYCGELFVFELTPRQAKQLRVEPGILVAAQGLTLQHHDPHPDPLVRIEGIEIDGAAGLDRTARITGLLRYWTSLWWPIPLAVQVACAPGGYPSRTSYHHFDHLAPPEGTVRFSVSPIGDLRDGADRQFTGVVPLFVQLCVTVGLGDVSQSPIPEAPFPSPPIPVQPAGPGLPERPVLGRPFVPPAGKSLASALASAGSRPARGSPHKCGQSAADFRTISDVRAVLVEVV